MSELSLDQLDKEVRLQRRIIRHLRVEREKLFIIATNGADLKTALEPYHLINRRNIEVIRKAEKFAKVLKITKQPGQEWKLAGMKKLIHLTRRSTDEVSSMIATIRRAHQTK